MEKVSLRKLSSLVLLFAGIILAFSGIILYITPAGRISYWNDWSLLGLSKTEFTSIHITTSYLFLLFALIHIIYNWSAICNYMKNKISRKYLVSANTLIALSITLVFAAGTYLNIVPFRSIIDIGDHFKGKWMGKNAEPPYGHAELSSIRILSERTKIDLAKVEENFRSNEIKYSSPDETLLNIARQNKLSPRALYIIMTGAKASTERPGMGK